MGLDSSCSIPVSGLGFDSSSCRDWDLSLDFAEVAVEVSRNNEAPPPWLEPTWFEGPDGQPSLLDPFLMEFFVDDWNMMFNA